MQVLTIRIPEDLLKDLQEIEKEERSERAEVARKLLDKGVQDWKMSKALKMISDGRWSVRRAAKFAGLNLYEILDKMAEHNVDSGPTLKEFRESLDEE